MSIISNHLPNHSSHYAPKPLANKAEANLGARESNQTEDAKSVDGIVKTEAISAEQAASNILNHVAKGLQALRQSGASEEQIQERLEQAKAGIEKGYAEAKDILKSMNLLTEELSNSIAKGRKLVDDGLAKLAGANVGVAKTPSSFESETYSSSASMELEMRTLEGDIVKISFEQNSEISNSRSDSAGKSIQQFSAFNETGWQLSVEGELSEKELESLAKVIKGVQQLGSSFFSGDLSSAMDQASKLGMGANELASLSLSMQQTQTYQAVSAYQTDKKEALPDALQDFSGRLAGFADQVKQTFESAMPLAESNKLLKQLTEKMFQGEVNQPNLLKFMDAFEEQLKS